MRETDGKHERDVVYVFFRLGYHVGISIYEIGSAYTLSCSDSEREGVRCCARREGVIVTVTEVD